MIKKILIANRGEIAVRILRACRDLNLETISLFTPVDRGGLWNRLSDQPVEIDSYLNLEAIVNLAKEKKADAIHPGYGFLSERPRFSKRCEEEKIIFIGPSSTAIQKAGDKVEAKKIAALQKIPVLPGSPPLSGFQEAENHLLDFPFIIKAAAGGGGRGMRIIRSKDELKQNFESAFREAESGFGDGRLYFEQYIDKPRHIEIQILADQYGNAVYFPERECSIQRRYQKLIEESPSPLVGAELRKKMGEAALSLIRAVGYTNAGTVEFIVDQSGRFYFLEMNARLQVEHPVTEMVTGIDLVKAQIQIASGGKLTFTQNDIQLNGWAFEARINAEDPYEDFLPYPDKITKLRWPGNARVDTALYEGYAIPAAFDSLIAKMIVHAENREQAIHRMIRSLQDTQIGGIATTIPFHLNLFGLRDFQDGKLSTDFIKDRLSEILPPFSNEEIAAAKAVAKLEHSIQFAPVKQNRWSKAGRLENLNELYESPY